MIDWNPGIIDNWERLSSHMSRRLEVPDDLCRLFLAFTVYSKPGLGIP